MQAGERAFTDGVEAVEIGAGGQVGHLVIILPENSVQESVSENTEQTDIELYKKELTYNFEINNKAYAYKATVHQKHLLQYVLLAQLTKSSLLGIITNTMAHLSAVKSSPSSLETLTEPIKSINDLKQILNVQEKQINLSFIKPDNSAENNSGQLIHLYGAAQFGRFSYEAS